MEAKKIEMEEEEGGGDVEVVKLMVDKAEEKMEMKVDAQQEQVEEEESRKKLNAEESCI